MSFLVPASLVIVASTILLMADVGRAQVASGSATICTSYMFNFTNCPAPACIPDQATMRCKFQSCARISVEQCAQSAACTLGETTAAGSTQVTTVCKDKPCAGLPTETCYQLPQCTFVQTTVNNTYTPLCLTNPCGQLWGESCRMSTAPRCLWTNDMMRPCVPYPENIDCRQMTAVACPQTPCVPLAAGATPGSSPTSSTGGLNGGGCANPRCSNITEAVKCNVLAACQANRLTGTCNPRGCGEVMSAEVCYRIPHCSWNGTVCGWADCGRAATTEAACVALPHCVWNGKCALAPPTTTTTTTTTTTARPREEGTTTERANVETTALPNDRPVETTKAAGDRPVETTRAAGDKPAETTTKAAGTETSTTKAAGDKPTETTTRPAGDRTVPVETSKAAETSKPAGDRPTETQQVSSSEGPRVTVETTKPTTDGTSSSASSSPRATVTTTSTTAPRPTLPVQNCAGKPIVCQNANGLCVADAKECPCATGSTKCPWNGQCVTDRAACGCPPGYTTCDSGRCAPPSLTCDGKVIQSTVAQASCPADTPLRCPTSTAAALICKAKWVDCPCADAASVQPNVTVTSKENTEVITGVLFTTSAIASYAPCGNDGSLSIVFSWTVVAAAGTTTGAATTAALPAFTVEGRKIQFPQGFPVGSFVVTVTAKAPNGLSASSSIIVTGKARPAALMVVGGNSQQIDGAARTLKLLVAVTGAAESSVKWTCAQKTDAAATATPCTGALAVPATAAGASLVLTSTTDFPAGAYRFTAAIEGTAASAVVQVNIVARRVIKTGINGPSKIQVGKEAPFYAVGPSTASFAWTVVDATGRSVAAANTQGFKLATTGFAAGVFTVSVAVTAGNVTGSASTTFAVVSKPTVSCTTETSDKGPAVASVSKFRIDAVVTDAAAASNADASTTATSTSRKFRFGYFQGSDDASKVVLSATAQDLSFVENVPVPIVKGNPTTATLRLFVQVVDADGESYGQCTLTVLQAPGSSTDLAAQTRKLMSTAADMKESTVALGLAANLVAATSGANATELEDRRTANSVVRTLAATLTKNASSVRQTTQITESDRQTAVYVLSSINLRTLKTSTVPAATAAGTPASTDDCDDSCKKTRQQEVLQIIKAVVQRPSDNTATASRPNIDVATATTLLNAANNVDASADRTETLQKVAQSFAASQSADGKTVVAATQFTTLAAAKFPARQIVADTSAASATGVATTTTTAAPTAASAAVSVATPSGSKITVPSNIQLAVAQDDEISVSVCSTSNNTRGTAGLGANSRLKGEIVDFSLVAGDGSTVEVRNVQQGLTLEIPVTERLNDTEVARVVFWDVNASKWSTAGISSVSRIKNAAGVTTHIRCQTTHLSEYTVEVTPPVDTVAPPVVGPPASNSNGPASPTPSESSLAASAATTTSSSGTTIAIIVGAVLGVGVIAAVIVVLTRSSGATPDKKVLRDGMAESLLNAPAAPRSDEEMRQRFGRVEKPAPRTMLQQL